MNVPIQQKAQKTDQGYVVRHAPPKNVRHNGWLTSVDETERFPLWVNDVGIGFTLNGSTAQSQSTRSFFPRSLGNTGYTVAGQTFSQAMYRRLGEFIRKQQLATLATGRRMALHIPQAGLPAAVNNGKMKGVRDGISALGYIQTIETGARFGEFAPAYTFTFVIVRSRAGVFTETPVEVRKIRTWEEVFDELRFTGENSGHEGWVRDDDYHYLPEGFGTDAAGGY